MVKILDKNGKTNVINEDKDHFKNAIILLITLIIPLTISVIAVYAAYYIPSSASLGAQQDCHYSIPPYTNMSNITQYNECVEGQTSLTASNEFTNLGRYLGQSFIILFIIVTLILFYIFFTKGLLMYITEIAIAILTLWDSSS